MSTTVDNSIMYTVIYPAGWKSGILPESIIIMLDFAVEHLYFLFMLSQFMLVLMKSCQINA